MVEGVCLAVQFFPVSLLPKKESSDSQCGQKHDHARDHALVKRLYRALHSWPPSAEKTVREQVGSVAESNLLLAHPSASSAIGTMNLPSEQGRTSGSGQADGSLPSACFALGYTA